MKNKDSRGGSLEEVVDHVPATDRLVTEKDEVAEVPIEGRDSSIGCLGDDEEEEEEIKDPKDQ